MAELNVRIGGMNLKNPVMTASGTAGYGEEISEFFDPGRLGALVVKGISLKPMPGNKPPRICETPSGMINSIGLQNVGLQKFLKDKLPFARRFDTNVIVNVLGNTPAEYVKISSALDDAGVEGIELNVSCPNVKKGGMLFGADIRAMARVVSKVREAVKSSTLIVKLSPNIAAIGAFARAAEDAGADAISLINTIPAMAVDATTRKPKIRNVIGGLSGPAIKPVALRMVWEAGKAVNIPVIGIGGITGWQDAVEFLLCGASAVQVGTGTFLNPCTAVDIIDGIEAYLDRHGNKSVREIIGGLVID